MARKICKHTQAPWRFVYYLYLAHAILMCARNFLMGYKTPRNDACAFENFEQKNIREYKELDFWYPCQFCPKTFYGANLSNWILTVVIDYFLYT